MLRSPARLRLITSHLSPVVVVPKPSQAKQMSTNPVRKLADGGEIEHGLQLDAQRADMVQDIISLFCSKPSREKLDKHFAPNATFEDPICIAQGLYPEIAAQWFGMPKAFPVSVTEAYTVTRNEQNLIEYEQRQNYTIAGLGTQKVMYSLVHMELDNNGKIIKFEDRWNGSPQPANAVAKFLRRLNGKSMPKLIAVPKV